MKKGQITSMQGGMQQRAEGEGPAAPPQGVTPPSDMMPPGSGELPSGMMPPEDGEFPSGMTPPEGERRQRGEGASPQTAFSSASKELKAEAIKENNLQRLKERS